jgi:Zn/Cd-binding protein ZinT
MTRPKSIRYPGNDKTIKLATKTADPQKIFPIVEKMPIRIRVNKMSDAKNFMRINKCTCIWHKEYMTQTKRTKLAGGLMTH